MRSFALIASVALAAVFSQVSGESSEDFQRSLGISDAELAERKDLVARVEKQEIWGVMSATQQERLRHAILLDEKVPMAWTTLTSYDKIVDPAYADFRWRMVHWVPKFIRDKFINALPAIPHEETVEAASKASWYASLSEEEQKELDRLILTEQNIPEGFESWQDAINDDKIGQYIQDNKDTILKPKEESSKTLQQTLGVTDKELQYRKELFSEIQKVEIYGVMTPIQQERLRIAVLLNKPRPIVWNILTTYEKILLPENAPFLRRLVHFWPRNVRDFFMNALPRIPHEDVVKSAAKQSWWKSLTAEEQSNITKSILRGTNVPQGFDSWRAALDDPSIASWVQENKDKIVVE